ncbi:hypothetical protein ACFP2V_09700, partial [Streptomyces incanus]
DAGAWKRIAARGLTHQAKTVADRTGGAMVIRSVVDRLEAKAAITPTTGTGPRPDPPGIRQHVRRPGDAGHPPPPDHKARRASVRRDTLTRTGPGCPAQPTGTRT